VAQAHRPEARAEGTTLRGSELLDQFDTHRLVLAALKTWRDVIANPATRLWNGPFRLDLPDVEKNIWVAAAIGPNESESFGFEISFVSFLAFALSVRLASGSPVPPWSGRNSTIQQTQSWRWLNPLLLISSMPSPEFFGDRVYLLDERLERCIDGERSAVVEHEAILAHDRLSEKKGRQRMPPSCDSGPTHCSACAARVVPAYG
jgi:hypothetical protein